MLLFHGSDKIIKKPVYGQGSKFNDYGKGFYCTQEVELAGEWACKTNGDGYVNKYTLNENSLAVLNMCELDILNWICVLVEHRRFEIGSPVMERGYEWLVKHYHIDVDEYDMVIGYRADDSYFSFAKAFLSNQISLEQLGQAMKLGKLGIQYVLTGERAFEALTFEGFEIVPGEIYYPKRIARDQQARDNYRKLISKMDYKGKYIRDLME